MEISIWLSSRREERKSKQEKLVKQAFKEGELGMNTGTINCRSSKLESDSYRDELEATVAQIEKRDAEIRSEIPSLRDRLRMLEQETLQSWNSEPRMVTNITKAREVLSLREERRKDKLQKIWSAVVWILLLGEFAYGYQVAKTSIFVDDNFISTVQSVVVGSIVLLAAYFCKHVPSHSLNQSFFKYCRTAFTGLAAASLLAFLIVFAYDRQDNEASSSELLFQVTLIFSIMFTAAAIDLWRNSESRKLILSREEESQTLLELFESPAYPVGQLKGTLSEKETSINKHQSEKNLLLKELSQVQSSSKAMAIDVARSHYMGCSSHPSNEQKNLAGKDTLELMNKNNVLDIL